MTADAQDLERRVVSLRSAQPGSEPGAAFHYSDPNYQVLALPIEVVTGKPWAQYLGEEVFGPLGMARTVATATADEAVRAARDLAQGHILVFGLPVARPELVRTRTWRADDGASGPGWRSSPTRSARPCAGPPPRSPRPQPGADDTAPRTNPVPGANLWARPNNAAPACAVGPPSSAPCCVGRARPPVAASAAATVRRQHELTTRS